MGADLIEHLTSTVDRQPSRGAPFSGAPRVFIREVREFSEVREVKESSLHSLHSQKFHKNFAGIKKDTREVFGWKNKKNRKDCFLSFLKFL